MLSTQEKHGKSFYVFLEFHPIVKSQRLTVESVALALAPIYKGDNSIMAYRETLKPWAVARLLPNLKWTIVNRYRSRADAEGHLRLFRQRVPNYRFEIVFDLGDRAK